MKKEKTIRTYQRRTKSGKVVTVRQHTASYDAAEKLREMAKKKGAGKEFEDRKSKGMPDPSLPLEQYLDELSKRKKESEAEDSADVSKETKKGDEKKTTKKARPVGSGTKVDKQTKAWFNSSPSSFSKVKVSKDKFGWRIDLSDGSGQVYDSKEAAQKDAKLLRGMYKEWKGSSKGPNGSTPTKTSSSPAFTAAEFKEWYHGTGSAADKKVAKALRAQLGRAGYRKFEDEAIDNYSSRGHLSMFKRVSGGSGVDEPKKGAAISKATKDIARGSKEKATEAKSSKAKESKSVKAPKNESQGQREARWNRGEFTADEKATAIMVYDLSGSKNNLHPKLSAWAKKEIKRMDDERAAKVDTKILKGLNRGVVSKLATLQSKKKLSKDEEAFIEKHVDVSGNMRGTKISAFDAIAAHRKDSSPKNSSTEKSTSAKAEKTNGYTIVKGPGMMGDDFAVKDGKAYTRDVTKKNPKWKPMKEGPVQRKVLEYHEALQDTSKPSSKLYSAKAGSKRPIDDPFKRARLIEVLRNKGKGEFDRVQMIHDFKEYFSRKGGWTPSVKGKELLKEASKEERSLRINKSTKRKGKASTASKESTKASSTTSTTGAGADWSKATVDKIGREYGGGYTIVGTPNDGLWSSTNFRTKSQALDFIKRKQKANSGLSEK